MITLTYDHSFEGLLSAIFQVYALKFRDVDIRPQGAIQENLFADVRDVVTSAEQAARVWGGLENRISKQALKQVYHSFLSELPGMENMILHYTQYALVNDGSIEKDLGHAAVKFMADTARKVHREKHRMEAFVRFRRSEDDLYLAEIEPDFNVLPLIAEHFEKRYADQQWMIFDQKRNYGIHYDLHTVEAVCLNSYSSFGAGGTADSAAVANEVQASVAPGSTASNPSMHADDIEFQRLWAHYFKHVNIKERKNIRLHLQHMPRRYWKYLPEKRPGS